MLLNTATPYDERALLLSIAEGDEAAFRQLFVRWHQVLAGYVFRITESNELTEEIVQDVFMKVWTVREKMTEVGNFKYYLLAMSRNRAFDVLKKLLREREQQRAWEKDYEASVSEEDELESARLTLIRRAIDRLPPRRKEVFLLSREEKLSYKDIAARLDISTESVKTHLKLASSSISNFVRLSLSSGVMLVISLLEIF